MRLAEDQDRSISASSFSGGSLGELRRELREVLVGSTERDGGPRPREANLLLAHVLGISEATVLAYPERTVSPAKTRECLDLAVRRAGGEPIAYLFGEREFFGRSFFVDNRVLVPRPETERLIETALDLDLPDNPKILDLGTGSGCIAATLALELPTAQLVATDISIRALDVARSNFDSHDLADRMNIIVADLATSLVLLPFDLIVSNPPYIALHSRSTLPRDVIAFEPAAALFGGRGGFEVIERLVHQLSGSRAGCFALIEIGFDQSQWLRKRTGSDPSVELLDIVDDDAGIPRIAVLRRTSRSEIQP